MTDNSIKLTSEQLAYVNSKEQYSLVIACPGSGKTEILASRIAGLIINGVDPERILAITFTRKAANEMRKRVREKTGSSLKQLRNICTFHSFGIKVISYNHQYFGLPERVQFATAKERTDAACKVLLDEDILCDYATEFDNLVSAYKNGMKINTTKYPWFKETLVKKYDNKLRTINKIDVDDCIFKPFNLFKDKKSDIEKGKILNMFDYIFVDEYQDVNNTQVGILEFFEDSGKVCSYVGDDDQSIYQFRGSEPKYLIEKAKNEKFKKYYLKTNFRSDEAVVDFANSFLHSISGSINRIEKHGVTASNKGGSCPSVMILKGNKREEINFICDEIKELVVNRDIDPSQIAVISRYGKMSNGHEELKEVKESLLDRGISSTAIISDDASPWNYNEALFSLCEQLEYYVYGGDLVKSLCYLRQDYSKKDFCELCSEFSKSYDLGLDKDNLEKSLDTISRVDNVLEISFGDDPEGVILTDFKNRIVTKYLFIEEQRELVRNGVRVSEIIANIIAFALREGLNIDKTKGVLYSLKSFALSNEEIKKATIENYKETVEFLKNCFIDENFSVEEGKVTLLTAHKSKGLQFDVVFVMGMEAGNFPSTMSGTDLQSEMRLFYVAITRAVHLLYVTATNIATDMYDSDLTSKSFIAKIESKYLRNKRIDLNKINFYSDPNSVFAKTRQIEKDKLRLEEELSDLETKYLKLVEKKEKENHELSCSVEAQRNQIHSLSYEITRLKSLDTSSSDKARIRDLENKLKVTQDNFKESNRQLENTRKKYLKELDENKRQREDKIAIIEIMKKNRYGEKYKQLDADFKIMIDKCISFFENPDNRIALSNSSIADKYLGSIKNISSIYSAVENKKTPTALKKCIDTFLFRDQMVPVIRQILAFVYRKPYLDSFGGILNELSSIDEKMQKKKFEMLDQYAIDYTLLLKDKELFRNMDILTSILCNSFHATQRTGTQKQNTQVDFFFNDASIEERKLILKSYYSFVYALVMCKHSKKLFVDIAYYATAK